ncbi:MAG: ABC transporter permease [Bacteroidetes bacterium]|nr:ABC transporter permease [Bacteroidota bacterium]MDF1865336.1 ABC transporter permease [Saprospiraceae bacterium]
MNIFRETIFLLRKELKLEWREKYAISGIGLYVLSTIFIVHTANQKVEPKTWIVLFWIIVLFASVNAVVKSFVQESGNRQLYYYQLANPTAILLSKILYNTLLLLLLSTLSFITFGFIAGNPIEDYEIFFLAIFLASLGFSITFTFISAIAGKTDNSSTLMAILSFPLVIPILLLLLKLSANALPIFNDTNIDSDITILVSIDLVLLGLALVLFPFLWRD